MRTLLLLLLVPCGLALPPGAADELVARLVASPDEAVQVVLEARELDDAERRRFTGLAEHLLSIDALSSATQELVALDRRRADRWALEICQWLPPSHGYRQVGPPLLARVWSERAVVRQLTPITRGKEGADALALPLLRVLQHRACERKTADLLADLATKPPAGVGFQVRVLAIRALPKPEHKKQVRRALKAYAAEYSSRVRAAWVHHLATDPQAKVLSLLIAARVAQQHVRFEEADALLHLAARVGNADAIEYLENQAVYGTTLLERVSAVRHILRMTEDPRARAALEELQRLSADEEILASELQIAILESLTRHRDGGALEKLERAVHHEDVRVRVACVSQLRHYPEERVIPIYMDCLDDAAGQVVSVALWGLFSTRRGAALDVVFEHLPALATRGGLPFRDAIRILKQGTGEDHGEDVAAWQAWRAGRDALPETFTPPTQPRGTLVASFFQHPILSYHAAFVLDVSGSMGASLLDRTRIQVLRDELEQALRSLDPNVEFTVILFESRARAFPLGPCFATESHLLEAVEFVRGQQIGGGTRYIPPLTQAFDAGAYDTIYFFSDGEPESPGEVTEWLARRNADQRMMIHTVGVDARGYLIQMANRNSGFYRSMTLDWWAPRPAKEK